MDLLHHKDANSHIGTTVRPAWSDHLDDEDKVYDLVPELKTLSVLAMAKDGKMSFAPPTQKITLRRLLSHTSGIGMDLFDPRLQTWRMERRETCRALCGKSLEAYSTPLLFEPGQGWAYGGSAEFAGILVERLNGMKLGEYMKKYIFTPLDMGSTTFHPHLDPMLAERLVEVSSGISDGTLVPGIPLFPTVTDDDSGAMGLASTLGDMTKLTIDLLQDQPKILSKESIEELCSSQFEPFSPPAFALEHTYVSHRRPSSVFS